MERSKNGHEIKNEVLTVITKVQAYRPSGSLRLEAVDELPNYQTYII